MAEPPPELYIYYYTTLPLNLAEQQSIKQASNNNKQQALLLSILAIAPPHRLGLYCTLGILEPRWWPCKIQFLSQKLTSGAPGRGCQVGRCPPKSAHFMPQNSLSFGPKLHRNPIKTAKRPYGSKVRAKGTTWCIQIAEGAKLDQTGLKMGSKHLFVHPQWSKVTFGKTHF